MVRFLMAWIASMCLLSLPASADEASGVADVQFVVPAQNAIVLPPQNLPELPEAAVVAMMLLGICVIGYRARRESKETFR